MGFLLHFHGCNDPLCVTLSRDTGCGHHNSQIPTAESALRAGPNAHPPLNMRNALIFQSSIICVVSLSVIGLKGKQSRRERDEMEAERAGQGKTDLELSSPGDGVEPSKDSKA